MNVQLWRCTFSHTTHWAPAPTSGGKASWCKRMRTQSASLPWITGELGNKQTKTKKGHTRACLCVRLAESRTHHLFRGKGKWVRASQSQNKAKFARSGVRMQVPHPLLVDMSDTGRVFSQARPPSPPSFHPPTHLLTGQQMEHGGAQATTSPATTSVCVCASGRSACRPAVAHVRGQRGYRCRCDPSCLLLATLSVIPPKWTVWFAFALHPGSADAAHTHLNSSWAWCRREASRYSRQTWRNRQVEKCANRDRFEHWVKTNERVKYGNSRNNCYYKVLPIIIFFFIC